MAKKNADYDGWVLRLLEKPEDILKSYAQADWLAFAEDKLGALSKNQIQALSEKRDVVFMLPQDMG